MSASFVLRDPTAIADPDSNTLFRYENTVGSPIPTSGAEYLLDGAAISDDYEIEFQKPASTVTADVTSLDTKNPYIGTGKTVVADGSTWNYNIIPGCRIKVSAGVVTGNKAKLSIGPIMATDGSTARVFNTGVVDAGSNSGQKRIAIVNVGSEDGVDTNLRSVPGIWWTPVTSQNIINRIQVHSDVTRELLAVLATHTITFANWADGTGDKAGKKVVDILVGGNTAVTAAIMDGVTLHQYGHADYDDGNDYLPGLGVILQNTTDDPSTHTVTVNVRDGRAWVEFAPDSAGSPGAWQSTALTVTKSGEASGIITAGGTAYAWVRWNLPTDAAPAALRRAFTIRTRTRSV
jgi:hypothetical protein